MRDVSPLTALLTLLDDERALLLAGQTDGLRDLAARKQDLIAALEASRPSRDDLLRLARTMARQETLLTACRDGLRGAQVRLAEVRSVRTGLNHYTKDGTVETITATGPVLEKRA